MCLHVIVATNRLVCADLLRDVWTFRLRLTCDASVAELLVEDTHLTDASELRFPRFFAFQRPWVMQPYPLSAEPQASLA